MEVSGQLHNPAPRTHFIGQMGPTGSLDADAKSKNSYYLKLNNGSGNILT
jgi:hypothetical protein